MADHESVSPPEGVRTFNCGRWELGAARTGGVLEREMPAATAPALVPERERPALLMGNRPMLLRGDITIGINRTPAQGLARPRAQVPRVQVEAGIAVQAQVHGVPQAQLADAPVQRMVPLSAVQA